MKIKLHSILLFTLYVKENYLDKVSNGILKIPIKSTTSSHFYFKNIKEVVLHLKTPCHSLRKKASSRCKVAAAHKVVKERKVLRAAFFMCTS